MVIILLVVHIALDGDAGIGPLIEELVHLIEGGADPSNIILVEVDDCERLYLGVCAEVWEKADIDGAVEDADNCIGGAVIVDGAIVFRWPNLHNVGDAWRFPVVLSQGDAEVGL